MAAIVNIGALLQAKIGSSEDVFGCKVTHKSLKRSNVNLHYVECGSESNNLAILLHGFPSFWYTWKYQFGPLSRAGFRIVAPDLRGFNLSSKPPSIEDYSRSELVADLKEFVDQLNGGRPAILIGHDWGGNVAWCFSQDHPDLVSKLVAINMPHPKAFLKTLMNNPWQIRKSWYILMFQFPHLGEMLMTQNNFQNLISVINCKDGLEQKEENAKRHIEAFSVPGSTTSSLNFYRSVFKFLWRKPKTSKHEVTIPVCVIWGEDDLAFIPDLAHPPKDLVPNCSVLTIPNATHWVMWDEPDMVNDRILSFLFGSIDSSHAHSKL